MAKPCVGGCDDLCRCGWHGGVFALSEYAAVEERLKGWPEYEAEQLVSNLDESVRELCRRLDRQLQALEDRRNRLLLGDTSSRPPRRMPSLVNIARYWQLDGRPYCLRCWLTPPPATWREANGWLVRAHIIDRVFSGLDAECNLAPLCGRCHGGQPIFKAGDEPAALDWFGLDLMDGQPKALGKSRKRLSATAQ